MVYGVKVTVNQRDLEGLFTVMERLSKESRFVWTNEVMDRAADIMADSVRKVAPKGEEPHCTSTETISESIDWFAEPDRRVMYIGAKHAVFQNDGTQQSPGRYVPAIKRRLIDPNVETIFHGTRGTGALEQGLIPYGAKKYKTVIKEALEYFGKDYKKAMRGREKHFDFETTFAEQMRDIKHEASFSSRVYGTKDPGVASDYAASGPEKLRRALQTVGISEGQIDKYMSEKFGPPVVLKVRGIKPILGQHYGMDGGIAEELGLDLVLGRFVSKSRLSEASRKIIERAGLSDEELSEIGKAKPKDIGMHPGVPALHFLERGLQDAVPEVGKMFEEYVGGRISAIVRES